MTKALENGYVALISVIVMIALLLSITLALNLSGFYARSNILGSEFSERSLGLAEACADIALLRLAQNPAYAPANEAVAVGSDACTVISVDQNLPAPGQVTIKTRGTFPTTGATNFTTNLRVIANNTSLNIISWEKVSSF